MFPGFDGGMEWGGGVLGAERLRTVVLPRLEVGVLTFTAALRSAQLDHQGLQCAATPPLDRSDATSGRCGVADTWRGAVLEEELAAPDRIAFCDVEPRAQTGIVIPQKSDPRDLGAVVDALFGGPVDRQVEALLDAVQGHAILDHAASSTLGRGGAYYPTGTRAWQAALITASR